MSQPNYWNLGYLPKMPNQRDAVGIGGIVAEFTIGDCHLVAYADAGFRRPIELKISPDPKKTVDGVRDAYGLTSKLMSQTGLRS